MYKFGYEDPPKIIEMAKERTPGAKCKKTCMEKEYPCLKLSMEGHCRTCEYKTSVHGNLLMKPSVNWMNLFMSACGRTS